MNCKGVVIFLLITALLIPTSSIIGLSISASASDSEMPYRGIIMGSYWEEWPFYNKQELLEPKIIFIGIVRHDGPMNTHYYRFEMHSMKDKGDSLYVESFKGVKRPHFLFGFCRFYTTSRRTTLHRFSGEFQGVVLKWPGVENIYSIISLNVNGTGLYYTYTGSEYRDISDQLRRGHYIELIEFNGTKTPFYISGTGRFNYYYNN